MNLLVIATSTVLVTYFSIFSTVPLPAVFDIRHENKNRTSKWTKVSLIRSCRGSDRLYSYTVYRKLKWEIVGATFGASPRRRRHDDDTTKSHDTTNVIKRSSSFSTHCVFINTISRLKNVKIFHKNIYIYM